VSNQSRGVTAAFDRVAATYDDLWTNTPVGQSQRGAFWRLAGPLFKKGQTILDMGCGTGEDAALMGERGINVIAIDSSPEMVRQARQRGIDARVLRIEDIAEIGQECDGAISNFGAVNCVERLSDCCEPLARLVRPAGCLAVCVMGRFCLWETIWYSLQGQFGKATRRWSGQSPSSFGLTVYYPRINEIRDALSPAFKLVASAGVGVFVPPSYVPGLSAETLRRLDRIDRKIAGWRGFRVMSDHRVLVFRRS
jgi:ubiquinone/menaquinone biosynthesis C-methylase UbiE